MPNILIAPGEMPECQKHFVRGGDRLTVFVLLLILSWIPLWTAKAWGSSSVHVTVTTRRIVSFDGIYLDGMTFEPDHDPHEALLPGVVLVSPWALPSAVYLHQARRLAESGMVVVAYAVRGFGLSEGRAGVGDHSDMEDMSAWIDWLTANTRADPERIGVCGISLGAGIALLGAAHDERIKAVCALSGWTDLYEILYHQQTAPRLWGDLLVLSGKLLGRVTKDIETMFQRLRNYEISSQELHAFADPRSPVNYLEVYAARNLPIYLQHSLGDNLFPVDSTIDFYRRLRSPKKLDLNFGEHITAELLALAGMDGRSGIWDRVIDWLGQELRDRPSSNDSNDRAPRVGIPVIGDPRTVKADEWPRTSTSVFHLDKGEALAPAEPARSVPAYTSIHNSWLFGASSGIPVVSTAIEAHTGIPALALKQLMLRDRVAVFSAQASDEARTLMGSPKLDRWVSSDSPTIQMVAYLYSVNFLGVAHPISFGAATVHQTMTQSPQKVSLALKFAAFKVPPGHQLMLAIDTFDPYFAAPKTGKYHVNFLYGGGGYDATIALPFLSE